MEERKKVLIISYYWPPSGGSGVQRWLKFTKYLRDFGWEPVIYTPDNPEFMSVDNTLEAEIPQGVQVIRREIFEPYSLYKMFTGKKGKSIKPGFIGGGGSGARAFPLKEKISLFIRSNLFIPDPKCMWIIPSAIFLKKYLRENPVDAIVSTGPPHSMHLIAKRVAKATGIPWLADFRDPWTKMYNFKYMRYSAPVRYIHSVLEKGVVTKASAVLTVTNTIAGELQAVRDLTNIVYSRQRLPKVEVITNGYDHADFPEGAAELDKEFTITYTGLFVRTQNPAILWKVLGEKVKADPAFAASLKIKLIGHSDGAILDDIHSNDLWENLEQFDYMSHDKITQVQRNSQILLLGGGMEPESKGILTGKFFEYLAARRPILGFGPKGGDMDIALSECEAGEMFDYGNEAGCRLWIEQRYAEYLAGGVGSVCGNIEQYSRKVLTGRLANMLDRMVN